MEELAHEWDAKGNRVDLLLPAGARLDEGEAVLRANADELKEPVPLFIRESSRRAMRNLILRRLAIAAVVAASMVAIVASYRVVRATQSEYDAKRKADQAKLEKEEIARKEKDAQLRTDQGLSRARVANSGQLAAQALEAIGRFPQRAVLLAIEAVEATRRFGEPNVHLAERALREALAACGGIPLAAEDGGVATAAVFQDADLLGEPPVVRACAASGSSPGGSLRVPEYCSARLTTLLSSRPTATIAGWPPSTRTSAPSCGISG